MTPNALLEIGLTNAALATLLAVGGWLLTRAWRNPHVASVVWLVVLIKLVTPPAVTLPVPVSLAPEPRPSGSGSISEPPRHEGHQATGGRGSRRAAAVEPRRPEARGQVPISVPLSLGRGVRGEGSETAPLSALHPSPQDRPRLHVEPVGVGDSDHLNAGLAGQPPGPSPQGEEGQDFGNVAEFDLAVAPSEPRPSGSGSEAAAPFNRFPTVAAPGGEVLAAIWLLGTMATGTLTIVRVVRFNRLLRRASVVNDDVRAAAERVARRLGLTRCPAVRVVQADLGPMVWAGAFSPVVIVPRGLWGSLGEAERETLLAHELAHVARRDHWVRRFEAVVLALYWWLPTAWVAVRRREAAAEVCCDALVLATYPDRPRAYAEALFRAVSVLSAGRPPALASGMGRPAELKERLAMIVQDGVPGRPGRWVRLGVAIIGAAALAVSAQLVSAESAGKEAEATTASKPADVREETQAAADTQPPASTTPSTSQPEPAAPQPARPHAPAAPAAPAATSGESTRLESSAA